MGAVATHAIRYRVGGIEKYHGEVLDGGSAHVFHTTNHHHHMKQIRVIAEANSGIKDNNNCTICALSTAAGIPYNEAYEIGKKAGRKNGRGFITSKLMKTARKCGIEYRKMKCGSITIQKFLAKYPVGRFIVRRSGHAFAIIDGTIYDHTENTPLQRITDIWKVESKRLDTIKAICKA